MPLDLVYYWRAGSGVHQAQGQWLGPARSLELKEEMFGCHIVRQLLNVQTRRAGDARNVDENWRRRSR